MGKNISREQKKEDNLRVQCIEARERYLAKQELYMTLVHFYNHVRELAESDKELNEKLLGFLSKAEDEWGQAEITLRELTMKAYLEYGRRK